MEFGYARVSSTKQDLSRQLAALAAVVIPDKQIHVAKKSGFSTDRAGLKAVLGHLRPGDVLVVHTLDRLGRTVRDTLNSIHDLAQRGVGVRNLADSIRVDSSNPDDPMGQLAVVMLDLFGQMKRTYAVERAAHARAVAAASGRKTGRPSVVIPKDLEHATLLRASGNTIAEIVTKTGFKRSNLYRHHSPALPPNE